MEDQSLNLPIKSWAEADRPREKMLEKGASVLTNAELLAILIGSGNSSESAVQLAQRILRSTDDNLNRLGKISVKELIAQFRGIGEAKAVTIMAALELGRRRSVCEPVQRENIKSSADAFRLFHPFLADLPHEELWIALTNRAGKVLDKLRISQGGIAGTSADLRLILKAALQSLASGILLCHNHPSGNRLPSSQDDALTQRLKKGAALLDITLLDHIIVADNQYYSYMDEGRL